MSRSSVVSVFGSATVDAGTALYRDGMRLGAGLARAGRAVATGGYCGLMEAVSRGAAEAGGQVLGFTCDRLEAWRPVRPNAWIGEEIRSATLRERLIGLIQAGDALVALEGGVGTLAEVALTWSMLQTGELAPRPLVLVGEAWRRTMQAFLENAGAHVRPQDAGWITVVPGVDAALAALASGEAQRAPDRRDWHG
jgi:hypothetical protein